MKINWMLYVLGKECQPPEGAYSDAHSTLEYAVLSEKSQSKRVTCQMIPFICNVPNRQSPSARKLTGDWLRLGIGNEQQ